jgi:hypothetical protein
MLRLLAAADGDAPSLAGDAEASATNGVAPGAQTLANGETALRLIAHAGWPPDREAVKAAVEGSVGVLLGRYL